MIYFLDARTALEAFLSLLMLPAAIMIGLGLFFRNRGAMQQNEDKLRLGKMLTMFGLVFLIILLICTWFFFKPHGTEILIVCIFLAFTSCVVCTLLKIFESANDCVEFFGGHQAILCLIEQYSSKMRMR